MSSAPPSPVENLVGQGPRRREFPGRLLLIRKALRPHVHAFYAFARNADDIADSSDAAAGGQNRAAECDGGGAAGRRTTARQVP